MTREEAKPYIGELQMYAKNRGWDEEYLIACDIAINELEQETVSKESYDHEYFLRKELEIKIARLEHDKNKVLDKIRAKIEKLRPNLRPEQMTDYDYAMVDVVNDIVAIINKYKAESEE